MTMFVPAGYRIERGMIWPDYDKKCAKVIFNMAEDLALVMNYVPRDERRVAIQAGGNCGVWPRALSPLFNRVYTFEPDPRNYVALAENIRGFHNVTSMNVAVGDDNEPVKMGLADHELDNCGAAYIETGGDIPKIRIDELNLQDCDLLYLDIEGFELPALMGARETIRRSRPVIAIEDKGLSDRYGISKGDAEKWLATLGYSVRQRIHRDVILTHASARF